MDKTAYFSDYDAVTDRSVEKITENGIILRSFGFIDFLRCAEVFAEIHGGKENCVGERDVRDLSFTFYTLPKPIMIRFVERNKIARFFGKKDARRRFRDFGDTIVRYGFDTYDMP